MEGDSTRDLYLIKEGEIKLSKSVEIQEDPYAHRQNNNLKNLKNLMNKKSQK